MRIVAVNRMGQAARSVILREVADLALGPFVGEASAFPYQPAPQSCRVPAAPAPVAEPAVDADIAEVFASEVRQFGRRQKHPSIGHRFSPEESSSTWSPATVALIWEESN